MLQKVEIIGYLGDDPELRYFPDGTPVVNFSVAAHRTWTNPETGEKEDETTWFRVAAWDKQAEAIEAHLRRGSLVRVEGRLRPDPQTGGPRIFKRPGGMFGAAYEVVAGHVLFLRSGQPREDEEEAPL
ncbi:MAG: single-stranded DNA-binding protein [Anaerolineae bacterium]|nr:single-stranded DNA-binding protein [Anaerolineae bacterium]